MTSTSKDTTPTRPSGFQSRSSQFVSNRAAAYTDDRTTWSIQESRRYRRESKRISLDIEFDDGTRLPHPENRELFEIAVEYLQLVRLYQPVIGLAIHKGRVTGLLTFLYWLNQRSIRSLAQVKPDHIELFWS